MAARVNYNKKILSGATKYSFILIIKLSYHGKGDAQTKNEQWRNLLMDCIPFMQTWLCSLCWRDPFTYKVKQLVFLLMVPDGRQISPWLQEVNLKVHKTFRRRFGRLLNVNCTFNLHPVSRHEICIRTQFTWLTLSWRRPLSYRNQSIDMPRKSMELVSIW